MDFRFSDEEEKFREEVREFLRQELPADWDGGAYGEGGGAEEARGSGITGTPTFIFEDGERRLPIVGAQDYAVFQNVAQRMGASRRTEGGDDGL